MPPFGLNKALSLVALTAIALLASACSSKAKKPPEPEFSAYFASHIKADGEKSFQIAFHPENQDDARGGRGSGGGRGQGGPGGGGPGGGGGGGSRGEGGGGPRGGERSDHNVDAMRERREQMQELLLSHTDQILMNNGYCREGYNIAKKERERSRSNFPTVKGSCVEKATAEDLKNFPNASATYEIKEESLDF